MEEEGACFGTDLGHVGGPANLDVPAANHHSVHLLQGQLCCLRHLILHKGKSADQGTFTNTNSIILVQLNTKQEDTNYSEVMSRNNKNKHHHPLPSLPTLTLCVSV